MIEKSSPSPESSSYLSRIQFEAKMRFDAVWNYLTNMRLVVLLVITLLLLGGISYLSIPRRLNPEIKIPIVTVVTALPGAGPADLESLVTIPLESNLQNIPGIDTMTSTSQDNVSVISIQFVNSVSQDKAKADVQSVVDTVTTLPKEAQLPVVKALDFEDTPVWTFALTTQQNDVPSLMRLTTELKKNLENTPKVDRVIVNGFEQQQIAVVVQPEKIKQYGLNPLMLAAAVKASIVAYPAGAVQTGQNAFSLSIDPQITSLADLRNLKLTVGGGASGVPSTTLALGDIATVVERSSPNQKSSYLATPQQAAQRAVTVSVYKATSADIAAAEKAIRTTVESTLKPYGDRVVLRTILNSAEDIETQFTDLLGEFQSTILLVFACLFVFLGLRQALIASFTVPLTFLASFVLMKYLGMSINFLSLFAFLLSLGLLVDDTIVVVSAMTTYFKVGKFSPAETGRIVWRDTIVPIWSTTITTIWSFVPLLLSTGIIGEFIKPIPVVVTAVMLSSTAIAVLITLPFMIVLLKPQIPHRVVVLGKILALVLSLVVLLMALKGNALLPLIALVYVGIWALVAVVGKKLVVLFKAKYPQSATSSKFWATVKRYVDHGLINTDWLSQAYYRLIKRILDSRRARRFVVFAITFYAVFAFALVPLGLVKTEFFPKSNEDVVYLNYELAAGTTADVLSQHALPVLQQLQTTPQLDFVTADVGASLGSMGAATATSNSVLFTLHLTPKHSRHITSMDIAENLRQKFKQFGDGTLTVTEVSGGPPAGADIQLKLMGDDSTQLNNYIDQLSEYLKTQPGVIDVHKSIVPGTSKLVFVPDQAKLTQAGLSLDTLGLWLRSFASGFTLSDAKYEHDNRTKKDIVFTFGDGIESPETVSAIMVPTQQGSVPLTSLGSLQLEESPTTITREGGKRTLSVLASVKPGFNIASLNKDLVDHANKMTLAPGYSWKTGGVNEENAKSVQSILEAMGLAFILILVTMVIQFQSYRQAVIVLLVIPLAVSSVFAVFALTGTPLSFPALIGILSLFGIVVTNSMFIVDKINLNLKEKMPFKLAIADAGSSRMEPIILTKLCTVFGLLPITISNPLWRGLGGAIISGLLIASTIMLLFIPVVYYEWMGGDKHAK